MTAAAARVRIVRDGAEQVIDVGPGACTIGRVVLHLGATWQVEARGGEVTVDGVPVAAGGRAALRRGGQIVVGGWTLIVEEPPPGAEAAGPIRTASVARELVRDLLGGEDAGGGPSLTVEAGPSAGQQIPLPPPPSRRVLGRGEDADIVVLDSDLSRHHVAFDRDHDGVRVADLGSKNGTRVGDEPVSTPRLLRAGDTIVCGATRLLFHDPAEEYLRALAPTPTPSPAPTPTPSLLPVLLASAIAAAAIIALLLLLV